MARSYLCGLLCLSVRSEAVYFRPPYRILCLFVRPCVCMRLSGCKSVRPSVVVRPWYLSRKPRKGVYPLGGKIEKDMCLKGCPLGHISCIFWGKVEKDILLDTYTVFLDKKFSKIREMCPKGHPFRHISFSILPPKGYTSVLGFYSEVRRE